MRSAARNDVAAAEALKQQVRVNVFPIPIECCCTFDMSYGHHLLDLHLHAPLNQAARSHSIAHSACAPICLHVGMFACSFHSLQP